jgi:hypothetical protein
MANETMEEMGKDKEVTRALSSPQKPKEQESILKRRKRNLTGERKFLSVQENSVLRENLIS